MELETNYYVNPLKPFMRIMSGCKVISLLPDSKRSSVTLSIRLIHVYGFSLSESSTRFVESSRVNSKMKIRVAFDTSAET